MFLLHENDKIYFLKFCFDQTAVINYQHAKALYRTTSPAKKSGPKSTAKYAISRRFNCANEGTWGVTLPLLDIFHKK